MAENEENPYAGILETVSGSWGNDLKPSAPLSIASMEAAFKAMVEGLAEADRQPRYEVTFTCEECWCVGFAISIVAVCPRCGHDGTLNVDRGYEHVLPRVRAFEDGRISPVKPATPTSN